jgi:hypothetical protein
MEDRPVALVSRIGIPKVQYSFAAPPIESRVCAQTQRLCLSDSLFFREVHIFKDSTVAGAMIATALSGMVFYVNLYYVSR